MRLTSLSTAIFILAAANAATAAPTPAPPTAPGALDERLQFIYDQFAASDDCDACIIALVTTKALDRENRPAVLDIFKKLCPKFKKQPQDVCDGRVAVFGPHFLDTLQLANINGDDGKAMCFGLFGKCPAPPLPKGTLKFPKERPEGASPPAHSGNLVDVLHLSDWHVDPEYTPGSEAECDHPMCCRHYPGASGPLTRAAASWGDHKCDTPLKLAEDMLKYIPTVSNAKFTIFTGDLPAHDIWTLTKESTIEEGKNAYKSLSTLPSKIYPTIGNHESFPASLFNTPSSGGSDGWLYNMLADEWSRWLPADAIESARHIGAYSASPAPGFRIISLNTNFCYKESFFSYINTHESDPFGEIQWLIRQLQAAEDSKERVWIIAHIGPSMADCLQSWSSRYNEVIQRYSPHVIAEQFFGHKHYDDFSLYYRSGEDRTANTAISTAYVGPSVTPLNGLNPGFRVYKVDTKSWNVFDSLTYIANLTKAAEWDATGATPDWHLEYSARAAYSSYSPISDKEPLSPSWWHNLVTVLKTNDEAFQKFWLYRSKSSGLIGTCNADSACPSEIICRLTHGESAAVCPNTSGIYKRQLGLAGSRVRRSQTLLQMRLERTNLSGWKVESDRCPGSYFNEFDISNKQRGHMRYVRLVPDLNPWRLEEFQIWKNDNKAKRKFQK
ncbi:hypothetical protein BG004_004431 [Podila humilis]|nr:hypothetical protein BG004_004431 [Podila humilis]